MLIASSMRPLALCMGIYSKRTGILTIISSKENFALKTKFSRMKTQFSKEAERFYYTHMLHQQTLIRLRK